MVAQKSNFPADERVLLISMPWGYLLEPCLGLGILKSVLAQSGIKADVLEAQLKMLRYLKYTTYDYLAELWAVHDFLFTHEFEPEIAEGQIERLTEALRDNFGLVRNYYRRIRELGPAIEEHIHIRQEIVPKFLDDLMNEIPFHQYSMVGLTCLFDQHWPALSLAKRIREAHPKLPIAFGGYALQPPTGPALQRAFPFVDVIAYGDGEPMIVQLARALAGKGSLADVPGISYRDPKTGELLFTPKAPSMSLDQSPAPDFSDYFDQIDKMRDDEKIDIKITEMPIESSRGCWWGQKSHCVFCGIDDETMKYRTKSANVVLDQLDEMHFKYGVTTFRFSDYIFPDEYYRSLLPQLVERGRPYNLHYEMKANATRQKIELLSNAGMHYVQPGIESFNSDVLKNMAKGVSGIQNLFLIHQLTLNHVQVYYNILFENPGDRAEQYQQIVELIPRLYHLPPPGGVTRALLTRFAPMSQQPERFGFPTPLRAHPDYRCIMSSDALSRLKLDMAEVCYYFERKIGGDPDMEVWYDVMQHQIIQWDATFHGGHSFLYYETTEDGGMRFVDSRTGSQGSFITENAAEVNKIFYDFDAAQAKVYNQLINTIVDLDGLIAGYPEKDRAMVQATIDEFDRLGLIAREGRRAFALAFPRSMYGDGEQPKNWWKSKEHISRFFNKVHGQEERHRRTREWDERRTSDAPERAPRRPAPNRALPVLA